MLRQSRGTRWLASCFAVVAGYVDAVAFIELSGFFVSFMSGNSTRFGVGILLAPWQAVRALGLIVFFVLGVAGGVCLSQRSRAVLLGAVAIGLLAAAAGGNLAPTASSLVVAAAMGAMNTVFYGSRDLPVGLTYMTGTLVKVGEALGRGEMRTWQPYAAHWLALVTGAALGSVGDRALGWYALALPAVVLGAMAVGQRQFRLNRLSEP